jgi:general secretion pathway protein I
VSSESGFTLLEVMIALAIVAIALVTLLGLANRSVGVHGRLQKMTQATLLAQSKVAEIESRARQQERPLESLEGVFDPPFEGFRWRVEFGQTPLASVSSMTVTVVWGDAARNEAVDLTSFLLRQGS